MAGTVVNTLYPPQIEAVAPAFSVNNEVKIYYAFSPYNSELDVNAIHITLVFQETNENVLVTSNDTEILVQKTIQHDNNGYYIILTPLDIIDGWKKNLIYKLQIRFDKTSIIPDLQNINVNYFYENQENFSEWSTVCLLQPTIKAVLNMTSLWGTSENIQTINNNGVLPIVGKLEGEEGNSSDFIDSLNYFIVNVRTNLGTNIFTSEKIYAENKIDINSLNYNLNLMNLNLANDSDYIIRINFVTRLLYTNFKDYYIHFIANQQYNNFNPTLEIKTDSENGYFKVCIKNNIVDNNIQKIYIKRTSSWSNFRNWEDFQIISLNQGKFNLEIIDNTIESCVWYRYAVQGCYLVNNELIFTPIYQSENVINDFYYAIFSDKEKQIKIPYEFTVTSLKQNINRSSFETLGNRYPKFSENGITKYYSMQMSGLISSQGDEQEYFLSKDAILGVSKNLYKEYNKNNQITAYNDFLWERVFRKNVLEWLNNGEPKLFRSQTEGNYAVILTDISLSPFEGTSRRLYSFSATAYEVGDASSLNSLNKLGLFVIEK